MSLVVFRPRTAENNDSDSGITPSHMTKAPTADPASPARPFGYLGPYYSDQTVGKLAEGALSSLPSTTTAGWVASIRSPSSAFVR
jgi:hypothetical protein